MNDYYFSNQSLLQSVSIERAFRKLGIKILRTFLLLLLLMFFSNTTWADFSVGGGYVKFNTTNGTAPLPVDCASDEHDGRMVIDEVNEIVYYCTVNGWVTGIGETGAQGSQGDTGAQGPQGDTGAQGPQGDTGEQGPQGDTGEQGPQGDTGEQGIPGDDGADGAQGPPGVDGNTAVLDCITTDWGSYSSCATFPEPVIPACNIGYTFTGYGAYTQSDAGCGTSSNTRARVKARCCKLQ